MDGEGNAPPVRRGEETEPVVEPERDELARAENHLLDPDETAPESRGGNFGLVQRDSSCTTADSESQDDAPNDLPISHHQYLGEIVNTYNLRDCI